MSVHTVLGKVPVSSLGRVLTHEHFNLDFDSFYYPPPDILKDYFEQDITLTNVGFIKQYPYSSRENIKFSGEAVDGAVLNDVNLFKRAGGGTICENTTVGIKRNLPLTVRTSQATGVHVIAGTGFYVELTQSGEVRSLTKEAMYSQMKRELVDGCLEVPAVRAGFIGEVGSSWPITEFERRCIQAVGEVQAELACGVSFHPGRDHQAPEEILRLYTEAGGSPAKAVMSHLDRTLKDAEELLEFSELGSYCQLDLFGTECSLYQLSMGQDMLSDAQRMDWVAALVGAGKAHRALMSHDIHTRHRLTPFGGHGYSHILTNVVPKMIKHKNIQQSDMKQILEENPQTWLANNLS